MTKLIHYKKEGRKAICGERFVVDRKLTEDKERVTCVECAKEIRKEERARKIGEILKEKEDEQEE